MLEANNRRALHANPVLAQLARKLRLCPSPCSLAYPERGDSKSHPHPRDAQFHQFQHGVFSNRVGRRRKLESSQLFPASFMRSSRRMARVRCSRKFSSMTKNDCTFELGFACGTSLRTAHRRFRRNCTNFPLPPKNAEVVQKLQPIGQPTEGIIVAAVPPSRCGSCTPMMRCLQAGNNRGMLNRRVLIFAQIAPHPGDSFSAHDVVGIDHRFNARDRGHMAADYDLESGESSRTMRHISRTLQNVHDDRGDSHHVILMSGQFFGEGLARGKIQQRCKAQKCSPGSS